MGPSIFPVIMCGGGGSRLWPVSRPDRPKQFLPLIEDASLFARTLERARRLVAGEGVVLVVAGTAHQALVREALAEAGAEAVLLLEPTPRDSAAAISAAAIWISARDPEAVAVVLPSDHHIPDTAAFLVAMAEAVALAGEDRIVTLGVTPDSPSEAYGYIRPQGPGPAPVAEFREKPDRATAARYVAEGCLWNSGMFIARARVLVEELDRWAPEIGTAVRSALTPAVRASGGVLSAAFQDAPRIAFDRAVMERTDRASVVPSSLAWSDLGAWDAVAAADRRPSDAVTMGGANVYVRAPAGVRVATLGVSDVAVIVEGDRILVCALGQAQRVRDLQATPAVQAWDRPIDAAEVEAASEDG